MSAVATQSDGRQVPRTHFEGLDVLVRPIRRRHIDDAHQSEWAGNVHEQQRTDSASMLRMIAAESHKSSATPSVHEEVEKITFQMTGTRLL